MMYALLWFLSFFYVVVILGLKRKGPGKLPNHGPFLIVCNHVHLLDPIAIGLCTFGKLHFMAKEELFQNKTAAWLLRCFGAFPVKRGAFDRTAIKTAIDHLENGRIIGLFPEGTRNKGDEGEAMLPMLNGASMLALKTGVPVYPAHISGKYRPFGRLTIRIGTPLDLSDFQGAPLNKKNLDAITQKIGSAIQKLKS